MSYPKYYATYCVMDGEAGSNPFWHAFLILSIQPAEDEPICVQDAVGFYSQPNTSTNPVIKGIKEALGFDIDLQDGHGRLQKEIMRYLDGNGLHGLSFEATEEQYNRLVALQRDQMAEEKAIQELNETLLANGEDANGHTRFIVEKSKAAKEERPPRLKPFHVTMELNSAGFDSRKSHTCKNSALSLLLESDIITAEQRDKILGGAAPHAFPRSGTGLLTPFRLVSTGEPERAVSRSGKVFYNRVWDRNPLYWATAPMTLGEDKPTLSDNQKLYQTVGRMLVRVRASEMALRHKINELGTPPHKTHSLRQTLEKQLQRVQKLYEIFSFSNQNQISDCLAEKLWRAETTLNVATMSLNPSSANYSFMFRAYQSISMRNVMLALLGLAIVAAFIATPIGAVLATTTTLFAAHQCYRFFKEETHFAQMRTDYLAFHRQQPTEETDDLSHRVDFSTLSPLAS